jgi:hypothetical protein
MVWRSKRKGLKPWEDPKKDIKVHVICHDGLEYDRDSTFDEIKEMVKKGFAYFKNNIWTFNFLDND